MSAALASFETPRDQWQALAWSVCVHVLALLVLVVGLWMSMPDKPVIAGQPIQAVLVDMPIGKTPPRAAPAPPKPTPPPPKPEPKPEPAPPPPPPQATPDDVTDQRPVLPSVPDVDAMSLQREQEEQVRREQEELRRQQELEQQRQQQLDEIRRQREEAARRAEQQAQQLAQLQESQRVQDILSSAAISEEPEGSVLAAPGEHPARHPLCAAGAPDSRRRCHQRQHRLTLQRRCSGPAIDPGSGATHGAVALRRL